MFGSRIVYKFKINTGIFHFGFQCCYLFCFYERVILTVKYSDAGFDITFLSRVFGCNTAMEAGYTF